MQSTESEPFSLLPMFFAKCLYSLIDDLTQNLFKITAQECEKSTSGPVDVRGSKRRCLSFLITMQERERVNERERKCSSWDTLILPKLFLDQLSP